MNISTVNELIQSLESAGELSIREQKFLRLAKAFKQLAAENVALKASIPPLKMINDVTDSWDDVSLAEEVGFNLAISAIMKNIPDTHATDRIVAGIKADEAKFIFQSILDNPAVTDLGSLVDWLEQHANDSAAAVRAMREGADK